MVLTHRLQGDDAVGSALAAEQLDLDVVDKKLFAIVLADSRELIATPVITRGVVDVFIVAGPRAPDQVALTIIDIAEQAAVGQVEFLVRQQHRHAQLIVLDAGGGNQRGNVRSQALFDRLLQGQAEGLLQGWQQAEHEQQGQQRRREHQTQT
ncbi:hypothetical protein D3C72_1744900 [compost metagenome]